MFMTLRTILFYDQTGHRKRYGTCAF